MAPSRVTLNDALRRREIEYFRQRLEIVRRHHRLINLFGGAGTVVTIKVCMRRSATSSSSEVLPLEPYANTNWTGKQYFAFFPEIFNSRRDAHPPLEICGIICNSLPVQIACLHVFLESRAEDAPRIMHRSDLDHMVNFVFTYAIRTHPFTNISTQLPQVIHTFNMPPGIKIVGRISPAIGGLKTS
jgi:hypothetical protein